MLRLKKVTSSTRSAVKQLLSIHHQQQQQSLPVNVPSRLTSNRFLDFYQLGNKDAIEKERARLKDEMNRGYFADMAELKQHGGKIATANKVIIPAMAAVKFPQLEVNYSNGKSFKLPITSYGTDTESVKADIPKATMMCLSFRAASQEMTDSWSVPFVEAFSGSKKVQLYEISFIESWLLSMTPIRKLLLRVLKKSKPQENGVLQRQIGYAFGDHYYFRKELKILNLLTGYIFLVDKFGRIRWQGFGLATPDEVSSLLSCTSLLLEEE
ncbi:ATPase assembly factor ATP10, mitochondria [Artemisia annua]|uniref:ATPase assembly factor ATP10, mitochondria n=2 Tax=Artemisia annua TaxID=35608 RepID=A0A2U1PZI5_ARTAN|nr:ATPase assembly factor ATP10, mitochondria [Artemisia annua]